MKIVLFLNDYSNKLIIKNLHFALLFVILETKIFSQTFVDLPVSTMANNQNSNILTNENDSKEFKESNVQKKSNNKDKRFYFISNSAESATQNLSDLTNSIQVNQKVNFLYRLLLAKKVNDNLRHGIDMALMVNLFNLKSRSISKDSFDIKSLIFPETDNSGLIIAPRYLVLSKNIENVTHRISIEGSYSLRYNIIKNYLEYNQAGIPIGNSKDISFKVTNLNIFPMYSFEYSPDDDSKVNFNVGIYFNYFNIPNEDVMNFNKIFKATDPIFHSDKRSYIFGSGIKISGGVNGFNVFVDLRQNFKNSNINSNNPFVGFLYNVGFSQSFVIHSF